MTAHFLCLLIEFYMLRIFFYLINFVIKLLPPSNSPLVQGTGNIKSGFPAINGGARNNGNMEVKDFKDLRIKQEMADQQNWSQTR